MSEKKKYESDTIKQQRRARKDFLELKKMQNGEISPGGLVKENSPATPEEKAQNFWYYNKFLILGIAFLVLIIGIGVKQCVSRINYDLSVTVYTANPVSDNDCKKVGAYFEKYCDDINGDGSVHIKIYNCSYTDGGNRQVVLANITKLQAILSSEQNALLFITDDTTYSYLNNVLGLSKILEDNAVILGDDFYSECEDDDYLKLPVNLTVSRRVVSDTTMQNNKITKACYNAAGKILDIVGKQNIIS